MIPFACLFSLILCQCGYGYPIEGDVKDGASIQNATSLIISSASVNQPQNISANKEAGTNLTIDPPIVIRQQHNSAANSSHQEELLGFDKKAVAEVHGGTFQTKIKVGGGKTSKVGGGKTKSKVGGGKTKSKVGGGGGTHYFRRPHFRNGTSSGGGPLDPYEMWIWLGAAIIIVPGAIVCALLEKKEDEEETTEDNGETTENNGATAGNNEKATGNNEKATGNNEKATGNNEKATGNNEKATENGETKL